MADFSVQDVYDAMRKADAAGDGEAVKALAAHLQSLAPADQPAPMDDATYKSQLQQMLAAPKIDRQAVHDFVKQSGHNDKNPSLDEGIDFAIAHPGTNFGVETEKPTSTAQGFAEGFMKPVNNAAGWLEGAADKIGIAKPIDALSSMLGLAPSVADAEQEQQRQFSAAPTQGSGFGRFAGETAGVMALTRGMGGPIAQGAAGGALLSDAKDAKGVAWDAVLGAAGSKLGDLGLRAAGHMIAPVVNPAVKRLIDAGVKLTPGQILGQGGFVGRNVKLLEDTLANAPISGPAIRSAQNVAQKGLNSAAINRALTPIKEALPDTLQAGHDAIAYAGDRLKAAYARVLPTLNGTLDKTFGTRVNAVVARTKLPPEYKTQVDQVLSEASNAFSANRNQPGYYSGRTLRDTSERLGDLAAGWRKSDDPYLRQAGDLAGQVRDQLHALARRQNPASAAELRAVDTGYANLVRVERAAAGTDTGEFTAGGLKTAVRQSDQSVRRRQSARGEALMQDLSSDAATVMPRRTGEGGSNAVNSAAAVGGIAVGAAAGNPIAIKLGAAGLASVGLYSRPGQAALRYILAHDAGPRAQYISRLVQSGVPRAIATAGGSTGAVTALHPPR
jgi:hypothetical protein